ncbi:DUF5753 domain-containing protein [Streptomyces sp. NPDC048737]|uniref:DUF5753 domain-containing protein n=1 Tax=unclassified Streptomyces TaxID=2593676 RepID=UPI0034194968
MQVHRDIQRSRQPDQQIGGEGQQATEFHGLHLVLGHPDPQPQRGPGQPEDYARAVFSAGLPVMSRLEVELRVANRMARRQVFERPTPLPYIAYVHEAALRMPYGGTEVTLAQLHHLADQSERDTVEVRVIPTSVSGFPGAGHALLYADGPVPQLDTVQLDSAHGPEFIGSEAQLTKYRAHLNRMEDAALSPTASRDLILDIARDL